MYKRNQVETAIERAIYGIRTTSRVAAGLRIRIKRLIETDRATGAYRHRHDPHDKRYALFDEPPPGRGTEVTYTAYGAFALLLAVRLMDSGLPQSEAILFMRRIRPELEREHSHILARKWESLIDHKIARTLEDEVASGRLVKDFDRMVFLVALPGQVTVQVDDSGKVATANIVGGRDQLTNLLAHLTTWGGGPIVCMELINPAHQLAYWLSRAEPIKRGRK